MVLLFSIAALHCPITLYANSTSRDPMGPDPEETTGFISPSVTYIPSSSTPSTKHLGLRVCVAVLHPHAFSALPEHKTSTIKDTRSVIQSDASPLAMVRFSRLCELTTSQVRCKTKCHTKGCTSTMMIQKRLSTNMTLLHM
jgi:hypothetical protein